MSDDERPARGTGSASAHHGEIMQGMFYDDNGKLTRGLVTLQYPERRCYATFYPDRSGPEIRCPHGLSKAHRAATLAMSEFTTDRSPATGGRLEIRSTIPQGIGMGSSTADVTATIRAIADFHGARPSAQQVGRMAVRAEGASDPVMIDDRVALFAQREGVVLEILGHTMPTMIVVGCDADPGTAEIVTLDLTPAAYSAADIEVFCSLRAELRAAVATGDVARIGRVATASTLISQRFVPKPALELLLDVCWSCGGCGVQVAHSGTVAGVIFDSRRHGVMRNVERCVERMELAGLPLTGVIGRAQAARKDALAV
jgi:uncharacterized protein involved in propanediol utilization